MPTRRTTHLTVWLGSRLTAAGYEVWADVLKLRGGQDWQRLLEDALRNKACKVLLVGTEHGVQKQGVRNEIQIAHTVSQRIDDPEFVIPLRLSNFDAPFLIAHAQYIDFERGWADGLAELLSTLEEAENIPRKHGSAAETMDHWKQVHLRHGQSISPTPESLVTNWLSFEQLPDTLYLYDFEGSINHGQAKRQISRTPWPAVPFLRGFLAFCPVHDLQDHFGTSLPLKIVDRIDTHAFLDDGWPDQHIRRADAHNQFSDLARRAIEVTLRQRKLTSYDMAGGQQAWWGVLGAVPSHQIAFSFGPALTGRRQIVGKAGKWHWHYGITPKPRVFPFPHVRFINRVLFTENGRTPIDNPERMHRLRRSATRSWRNARWRGMLLAFLHWLSDGENRLLIPVGSETAFSLRLPPLSVDAPVSIILGDDTEEEPDGEDDMVMEEYDTDEEPDDEDDYDHRRDDAVLEKGTVMKGDPTPSLEIRHIPEPQLQFGFAQKLEYPRDGLYLYGPPSTEVSEINYGVIGTAEGVRRFHAWSRQVSGFIDIPARSSRSRKIEPQHVPFPGFEQAFAAKWSVNAAHTISDIDSADLHHALTIENRHEAIMTAVDMYVDRLINAQNRLENPPRILVCRDSGGSYMRSAGPNRELKKPTGLQDK